MTDYVVSPGATGPNISLGRGDTLEVDAGGTATNTIDATGQESISGTTEDATVVAGGAETVYGGGTAIGTTVSGNFSFQGILAGGLAVETQVQSGGTLDVAGIASLPTVSAGRLEVRNGGAVTGATVDFGQVDVFRGGVLSNSTLTNGTGAFISSGGTTIGTLLQSNGGEQVMSGATASGTTVASGGILTVAGVAQDTVVSGSGAQFDVAGAGASAGTTTVEAGGTLTVYGGGLATDVQLLAAASATVSSGSTISSIAVAGGDTFTVASSGHANAVTLSSGATAVDSGTISGITVQSGGTLFLTFAAVSTGIDLTGGGSIVLNALGFSGNATPTIDLATDILTVTEGAVSSSLQLSGDYSGYTFAAGDNPPFGTVITDTPCYCPGTLILTDRGEIAAEALAIGDRVVTVSGQAEPIRWIGRRSYAGRFLAANRNALPVLIRAGALGAGLPRRDLRVSPLHAMFIDGALAPAGELVNGTTITQDVACQHVDYIHVELARHDVIFAEGAPSETFLDVDSRAMFHNASDFAALYPDAPPPDGFCAPRLQSGPALEAIRQRLAAATAA